MKLYERGSALVIAVIVVAVLAVAGGGYYLLTRNDDGGDNNETTSQSEDNADPLANIGPAKPPYTVTVTVTDDVDQTKDGSFEIAYQSAEAWKMTNNTASGVQFIFVDGYIFATSDGTNWQRLPFDPSNPQVTQVGSYAYSQEQIDNFKNNGTLVAEERCATGVCRVIEVANVPGVESMTLYVDKGDGQVVRIASKSGTTSTDIEFDFTKEVNVTAPENYQGL